MRSSSGPRSPDWTVLPVPSAGKKPRGGASALVIGRFLEDNRSRSAPSREGAAYRVEASRVGAIPCALI